MARELGLAECLRMGTGEESSGGRNRPAALEDAFEALIGALFLDTDYATTSRLVLSLYGPLADLLDGVEDRENPKGRLQELIQPLHGNEALRYQLIQTTGEDHARQFESGVWLLNRRIGTGSGPSKRTAEEAAARMALQLLQEEGLKP